MPPGEINDSCIEKVREKSQFGNKKIREQIKQR